MFTYSVLKASTGSRLAANLAGIKPASIVNPTLIATKIIPPTQGSLAIPEILTKCSYLRGCIDDFSSFLWADKREHTYFKYQDKKVPYQIGGHTPVTNIQIVDDIIFCDTHSTYRDGNPYGDKSYLVWNDRGFIIET